MNPQSTTTTPANGESTAQELFALTNEQILEIEERETSVTPSSVILSEAKNLSLDANSGNEQARRDSSVAALPQNDRVGGSETPRDSQQAIEPQVQSSVAEHGTRNTQHDAVPPKWLVDLMADPQAGAEARDLWTGVQQTRQEAAAFREVFTKPEEARAAAERARTLDEMDAAFYGRAGKSWEETSAARAALAQRLMREDPAAFREMVFAGLRALEEAGTRATSQSPQAAHPAHISSSQLEQQASQDSSRSLGMTRPVTTEGHSAEQAGADADRSSLTPEGVSRSAAQIAAYREFERAANEDLERSVGGAIDRALAQALPNARRENEQAATGARHAVPLQERLSTAIRQDIESALKGDRQLGEQIAQLLAARRFDDTTRAHVVRLINERAQQLVPDAARRVINEWTQTTLAVHRAKTQKAASAGERGVLSPADVSAGIPPLQSGNTIRPSGRNDSPNRAETRIDYRKLSDEQILNL